MPTGYTAIIAEGATFEQFVWRAARGMGALITMRDDAMDAPIPERFEPSPYYAEQLAKAQARKLDLDGMSEADADIAAGLDFDSKLASHVRHVNDALGENAKYEAIRVRVQAWEPPTKGHASFKAFMLEQLHVSMRATSYMKPPTRLAGYEWFAAERRQCADDLKRYAEEHAKEVARTEERNSWIAALRESVPFTAWAKP